MSAPPSWSYVQARLQARHGDRLTESGWQALGAVRSLDQFIDRARASSLRPFVEQLHAGMSSHAIERTLRAALRDYVVEVSSWCPVQWRPAVLWTVYLPELPVIDALLRGETPAWAHQDRLLSQFLERERNVFEKSPAGTLLPGPKHAPKLVERWYAHWRELLPRGASEVPALTNLAETAVAHVSRLDHADLRETSAPYRRAMEQAIIREFRHHSGTPIAVFCHLMLVALDYERLRGGLARRALFAPGQEAA